MRELRRQSRTEEVQVRHKPEKSEKETSSLKNSIDDIETLKRKYEKEILLLKEANNALTKSSEKITKNEQKVLSAIRSEKISQNQGFPIISRATFMKTYGINSKYLDDSITSLISRKMILREETIYSGNIKTYRWKILEQ